MHKQISMGFNKMHNEAKLIGVSIRITYLDLNGDVCLCVVSNSFLFAYMLTIQNAAACHRCLHTIDIISFKNCFNIHVGIVRNLHII